MDSFKYAIEERVYELRRIACIPDSVWRRVSASPTFREFAKKRSINSCAVLALFAMDLESQNRKRRTYTKPSARRRYLEIGRCVLRHRVWRAHCRWEERRRGGDSRNLVVAQVDWTAALDDWNTTYSNDKLESVATLRRLWCRAKKQPLDPQSPEGRICNQFLAVIARVLQEKETARPSE